ncbi:MAG: hypothetical protein EXS50_03630 [Candidatus Taylorbacteria bacterium]|nr:hypothetical protein [Candidatus Taylorbacteria bacterium]
MNKILFTISQDKIENQTGEKATSMSVINVNGYGRVLCVGLAGVIMNNTQATGDARTREALLAEDYASIRTMPDAIEILKRLQERSYGYPEIHIISRVADPLIGAMCKRWVDQQSELNGIIPKKHRHYCHHREDKTGICLNLGAEVMIDDRIDILRHMVGRVERLILFRPWDENENILYWDLVRSGKVTMVNSWEEVPALLF